MTRCRAARTAPQAAPDAIVALVRLLARQAAREMLGERSSPCLASEASETGGNEKIG